jgi:hypothetical protein
LTIAGQCYCEMKQKLRAHEFLVTKFVSNTRCVFKDPSAKIHKFATQLKRRLRIALS